MAIEPNVVFGAIAALIMLGFVGGLLFRRYRLNDTLLLIFVGALVGPALGLVPASSLLAVQSIVGPLALILILFDGGLALRASELRAGLSRAVVLSVMGFLFSTVAVGAVLVLTLNLTWLPALVLGAIVGGTSALVVMPALEHMRVQDRTKAVLGLESALTDVLVVVLAFSLMGVAAAGGSPELQPIVSNLIITFLISLIFGVAAAAFWLIAIPRVQELPHSYMLTLGVMFLVYVVTETVLQDVSTGGGPLAVLVFGIILGNAEALRRVFPAAVSADFGSGIKRFQGEIAFLVRTFFFVYLGILINPGDLVDLRLLAISVLVYVALLAARYVAVLFITGSIRLQGDAAVLWVMGPRGLAAAVLASEAANRGVPGAGNFVTIAFLILLFSNILATAGTVYLTKRSESGGDPAPIRRRTPPTTIFSPATETQASPSKASSTGSSSSGSKRSTAKAEPVPEPESDSAPTRKSPRRKPKSD